VKAVCEQSGRSPTHRPSYTQHARWSSFNIVPRNWTYYNTNAPTNAGSGSFAEAAHVHVAEAAVTDSDAEAMPVPAGAAEVQGNVEYTADPATGELPILAQAGREFTLQRAVSCAEQAPSAVALLVGDQSFAMHEITPNSQVYAATIAAQEQFSIDSEYPLQVQWNCRETHSHLNAAIGILHVTAPSSDDPAMDEPAVEEAEGATQRSYLLIIVQE
jgi:hypothetical protein